MIDAQPTPTHPETAAPVQAAPIRIAIPYLWVGMILLFAFALTLRVADLDVIPLSAPEAREALAAYRTVYPPAPASDIEAIVHSSPLLYLLQSASFAALGQGEGAARAVTAVSGALFLLVPLLFRRELGAGRAFALVVLFAFSPVLLFASRESAAPLWAAGFALMMLWAAVRVPENPRTYGTVAVVLAAVLVFLIEGAGLLWLALVAGAAWVAFVQTRRAEADDAESAGAGAAARGWLAALPWSIALPAALLVVVVVATFALLNLDGLSSVGAVLGEGVGLFITPNPAADGLFAYPLLVAVFYEPFIMGFALVAVYALWRSERWTAADRFFAVWLGGGTVLALITPGALSAHALWLTLPAAGLASGAVMRTFRALNRPGEWYIPPYSRAVLATVIVFLLASLSVALHDVTRSFMNVRGAGLAGLSLDPAMVVLLVVSALFVLISVFMAGTVWNSRVAVHGLGLGVLVFGLWTSLGAAWDASVTRADDPAELYRLYRVTHRDTALLRETLLDVAERESRGFTEMPLTLVAPSDGVAAWVARDFRNAVFVTDYVAARGAPVVLGANGQMPDDLGAGYLGQDFTLSQTWSTSTLTPFELAPWWTQRVVATPIVGLENADLWLRADIYSGSQFFDTQGQ
jgi:hypothetical protein